MTQPFETTFILFVDMLGFAALVEKEGDELNALNPIFTGVELYSPSSAESLLGYRFINFHRCLNQARVRLQEIGAGTAIVFFDSAFFRIDTIENAIHVARALMFELVTSEGACPHGPHSRLLSHAAVPHRLVQSRLVSHVAVSGDRRRPRLPDRGMRHSRAENPPASRPGAFAGQRRVTRGSGDAKRADAAQRAIGSQLSY
jgi:hypothetical protein